MLTDQRSRVGCWSFSWKLFSLDNLFFTLWSFRGCELFVEVVVKVEMFRR